MHTLLILCLAGTLFGQSSKPSASPRSGEQEKSAHNEQAVRQNNPPKSAETPIHAAAPSEAQTESKAGKRNNQPESPWRKYLCQAFGPAYLSNWVLAVFAVVAAGVALKSLNAIKGQARIARAGLTSMRVAASAARGSANAAKQAVEATIESNILTRASIKEAERANAANEAQMEQSNLLTAQATELTRQALHLTECADVVVVGIESNVPGGRATPIHLFHTIEFTLVFKNCGRSRANQIVAKFWMGVPDAEETEQPQPPTTVLGAGDTLRLRFRPVSECVNNRTLVQIADGAVPLRFEGQLTYVDIFGLPHSTECSGSLDPETCHFMLDRNEAG
ncbi:MAG: hypothetical protein ABSG26_17380 [Bryobacteraceae bacterium]|jgi:hypothetical protein